MLTELEHAAAVPQNPKDDSPDGISRPESWFSMTSEAVWMLAERLSRVHIAQLYSDERILIEALRMFTGSGLSRKEAVILMMTEPHRAALERSLEADGFDVQSLQRDGQLTFVNVEELIPVILVDGMPDAPLFKTLVGDFIDRAAKSCGSHHRVRIFGEMVNLLWKGNLPAAVRLEEIWNEVVEAHDISLFCAYSVEGSEAPRLFPQTLCAAHSHMIPAAIIDSSEDAIVGRTLDAKVVSWNRGAERIYGYTADELIGRPISILLPPGREDDVLAIVERLRRGEKVEHYETKRRRKDGAIIDVSITVSLIKTRDGDIIGASAVARDITERKQAEEASLQLATIKEAQARQRLLLERVLAAQEDERRRIARELHDEAGQLLASLLVGLRALEDAPTIAEAKAQARRLREISAQAVDEVGRLARGLHPAALDDLGLAVALSRYVAEYKKTHNIAVDLRLHEPEVSNLSPAVQIGLYRILQEALTNVARHSGAMAVRIIFARTVMGLEITVTDDGCGFDTRAEAFISSDHLGIQSMRERAVMLGGTMSITSQNAGTTVLVKIPLPDQGSKRSAGPRTIEHDRTHPQNQSADRG